MGAPTEALVSVGDRVLQGQKIGDGKGLCAPVHASVSGKVKAIAEVSGADGRKVPAITIENDGENELYGGVSPFQQWQSASPEEIRSFVRECGVVGMGGAGFPTHAKLSLPPGKSLNLIIVNGAECEPFLTCDHRLLVEQPETIILGIELLMKAAGVEHALIGAKVTMDGVPEALLPFLETHTGVDLLLMESKYPQGEERQLIFAATGKEIPSGGLPWDVGVLVVNVSTAWTLGNIVKTGIPSITRAVTVSGAVATPSNFLVKVGTPISNLIEAAGGFDGKPGAVILGGPMTGLPQHNLQVPITKQNNGVTVLAKNRMGVLAETDCIHCGKCVAVCPSRLMPLYMAKESQRENVDEMKRYNLLDCRECACCAYICPAKIPLLHWMRLGKGLIRAANA